MLAVGAGVSASCAHMWQSSVRSYRGQAFRTAATNVSDTAQTLLRRDTDFASTLALVLSEQPRLDQAALNQRYGELQGWQRQVGALGLAVISPVPAEQVRSFVAHRDAEPELRLLFGKALPVGADGDGRYCLLSTDESLRGALGTRLAREVQGDWCDARSEIGANQAPLLRLATDTGGLVVDPVLAEGLHTVLFEQAFYRRGAVLSTVAQRRSAVSGWLVSSFDMATLLHSALAGRPGVEVYLSHANSSGRGRELIAHGGAAAPAGYSFTSVANVEGPWTLTVRGAVATSGLSASAQALIVLALGSLVTLLLTALVLALWRSRERALGAVSEKAGELRHQAMHDALTGLPNRTLALDRAEQMLARSGREATTVAALYLNLDGFKHVNEAFGHLTGDEVLRVVADRIGGVVRPGDTVARLGGDEFLVLAEGSTREAGPELVAQRLLDVLRQPFEVRGAIGRPLSLSASVGIAVGAHRSTDRLLRHADLALHQAKAKGGNRYERCRSAMQTAARERHVLEMDLLVALERDELFLVYQPTFCLRSEQIVGVEALLRWRHPTRGEIPPDRFIPLAEQSGLIAPIGRWVLGEACRQAAAWHARGLTIGVAVNVSARQLDDDELLADVRGALQLSGLPPQALTLEITETALMRDADATAERLTLLKGLGVRIAIDDFGTGYSSLAYLRQFPADVLKIDRAFVGGITTSRASAAVVHALVQLGEALELETLAEGIEERAQLKALQRESCDLGQGFLLSRPGPASAIERLLEGGAASVP
jgi:diguanylate cyclase (GGDEF)-like protein